MPKKSKKQTITKYCIAVTKAKSNRTVVASDNKNWLHVYSDLKKAKHFDQLRCIASLLEEYANRLRNIIADSRNK